MVPKDLLHEGVMESIISLPGFSARYFPFCAQHQILQFIQRQLETHAFCFLQRWLPSESLAAGWTCPEALELHKFFRLLEVHQGKVKGECFQLTWSTLTGWRRVISSIRHAAVHRIPHDRKPFLKMVRAAIKFSKCIAGFESSKRLCRIQKFVKTSVSEFDQLRAQLKNNARLQISLGEAHPDHLARRLVLLPEAVKRVLQSVEDDFVSKVKQFLHAEFKST
ncbi:Pc22g26650 [Penicillium rubens Wisconsin 54-1255]|uniref:Pc22g26650 protein n=1 Tax=Penicillium rubens (strain ATCC 28089 / DSM 1075 / NRRL 1951 / Wisconsin 54-1255) TaxID=500485 RepID=B6HUA2_PENRW|nr:Pc22g26650 [Penicillium rubens Wisconsin 54-1255]